jgi:hypothetical protein
MKTRFCQLAILLFFFGCTEEETTPREYPRVSTVEAGDITSDGVTFKGDIIFSSVEIKDHGFVWSDVLGPLVSSANKISLGSKPGTGPFEGRGDRSLEDGKKYFVRAYAISDDFVVYGNTVEFVSLGSKAPVVKDFFPATGTWSDTVTVVGENFSDQNRTNVVKFGQNTASVIRSNKDTLLAIVPGDLTSHQTKLTVSVAGNSSSIAKEFQLTAPTIQSVTPAIGLQGTKVTITGDRLLSVGTKIFFGDTEATVLNWSSKKIECLVPNRPNGEVLLKVQTGTGGLFATSPFKIQPDHLPELYQVQPTIAKLGETIILTGDYFATQPGSNSVKFGNTPAQIISESKTQLEVIVPDTETRESTITVTSYGSSVSIGGFAIKSPVVTDFSPHRGSPGSVFTISGTDWTWSHLKVFLGDVQLQIEGVDESSIYTRVPWDLASHEATVKVTFYDEEYVLGQTFKSPWIILPSFQENILVGTNVFVHNNSAYLTMVGYPQSNQVWKFNNYQWSRLNDFPGSATGGVFSFTVGAKGYLGGGTINAIDIVRDLWEYDFANDTWSKKSDIPHQDNAAAGFAVGTNGYVFDTDYVNPPTLRMYNPVTDTWTIKSVAADASVTGFALNFVIGTSAYLIDSWGGQSFVKYTPSSNQWTGVSYPEYFNFAFAIGSSGYAGNQYSLHKFNPATNLWSPEVSPTFSSNNNIAFSMNGKGYVISGASTQNVVYEFDPSF